MKLYIDLLLSVSITGTVPFCIYVILKRCFGAKISASFYYGILKFCLLCFLFPFALLKSIFVNQLFPSSSITLNEYVYLDNAIIQTTDGYHLNPKGDFYHILFHAWLAVLCIIIFYNIYRYLCFRKKILRHLIPYTIHESECSIPKTHLCLNRPISIFYCNTEISPFTYGIFHPCIVITSAVPENAVSMAIRHELQHVRSHDFLYRCIAFPVILIHFWNPLVYLLWKELCEIQELACDEKITASFTPSEVHCYGCAILSIAASVKPSSAFITYLAQKKDKTIYLRITHLRNRFVKRSVSASVFLLFSLLIGFCIPVYACSPEIINVKASIQTEEITSTNWIYTELATDDSFSCPEDEFHFQNTDQYFIMENGTIIDLPTELSSELPKASCAHAWTKVMQKKHQPDNNGGCFVLTHSAELCTKCNAVRNQTLTNSNHYIVCPH